MNANNVGILYEFEIVLPCKQFALSNKMHLVLSDMTLVDSYVNATLVRTTNKS